MPTYTFQLSRVHVDNIEVLGTESTISWRLEGTGPNPLTADLFAGGVLPSGTLTFAAFEVGRNASFSTTPGTLPATDLTGRLALFDPVDCKIDPALAAHPLIMRGDDIAAPIWGMGPNVTTGWVAPKDGDAAFV